MSGHVGNLSAEQKKTLEEFRERCADVWEEKFDDYFALKWLRARKFSLDKAEQMLRNHLAYRNKIDLDHLVEWYTPPKVLQEYGSGGVCGFNRDGCPVWVVLAGGYDAPGIVQSCTLHELAVYVMYLLELVNETAKEQSKKLNKHIGTRVFIVDMENFCLKNIYSKLIRRVIGRCVFLYESNYPESLERAYIINAPSFFPLCWKILRPLLSDDTAAKVSIFGKDGWQDAIFETIERDQMPVHYGGTKVGPTGCPKCSELIKPGGIIPEKYFLRNISLQGPNVKTVSVPRRKYFEIPLTAEEAGHVINWVFRTDGHDLAFSILFKNGNTAEEVVPSMRCNCHVLPEEGFFTCEKSGEYVFRFDNTFSWFTDKSVTFDITVGAPSDDSQSKRSLNESCEDSKETSLPQRA